MTSVRPLLRSLLAVVAVAALPAVWPARAADAVVQLRCTVVDDTVKLGDEIELDLEVTNPTAHTVDVPTLRLADDAVSVRVTGGGEAATLTRLYGSFVLREDEPAFERRATPTRRVAPGDTVTARVSFPALRLGDLDLKVSLGTPGDARLAAEVVRVNVAQRSPSQRHLEARIDTTRGTIRVQIDATRSYVAAAQFWSLAQRGFYDRLDVFRVVDGTLVQSGDPRNDGLGDSGWYLPGDGTTADLPRGTLALARGAHPDSASSQWFVVTAEKRRFDPGFAPVGTVVEGIEIADELAKAPLRPGTERPLEPDQVRSIRVTGK